MLSPEENERLVEYVSELLAMAAMTMYSQTPNTNEHKHVERGDVVLCVHEYIASNGRTVRLYVNGHVPRMLTMSIIVGEDEPVIHTPPMDFKAMHDDAVVEALEHIFQLPDAEEPQL